MLTVPAFAGPPYVTDDPEPTPYRGYEIYLASDYARSPDGVDVTVPHLEFNYGLMPNVQVTTTIPLAGSQFPHGAMHLGYGDTEFEIKARLIQETDHFPQISIAPTVVLPSGNARNNLGGGYEKAFYPIWAEKALGKYTLFGGGGRWHNPGADNQDYTFTGVAVIRDMGHGLTVGTELFGQSADTVGGSGSVGFNFGANRQIDEHHEILVSLGRSLRGPNTFSAYAAYGLILGPRDKADAGDKADTGDKPSDKADTGDKPSDKADTGDKPSDKADTGDKPVASEKP
jgi:hypothetical protein